jgi:hypothetical protein
VRRSGRREGQRASLARLLLRRSGRTPSRCVSSSAGTHVTRPSASDKGMTSCPCPYPLVKSIRLNGDGREAPLPLDCGHFRDPIVGPRRNGLALAAEHVRLIGLNLPLLRLRSGLSLSLSRTRLDAMPAHRVSVPISVEDMDRLCANDSGVSTAIRTVLRDQTRTARLSHGFTSSLTEGEARSFLRYASRQGFERLATALRLIAPEK